MSEWPTGRRWRTLLADDEAPARRLLREYLTAYASVTIVAECANGQSTRQTLQDQPIDLLFLDINMPGLDGFQVLEGLAQPPLVVFSTAYDSYALQAFEVSAADYLLKPYDRKRFDAAMNRVFQRLNQPGTDRPGQNGRLLIRDGHRITPVRPEDILWVEAAGDFCIIHCLEEHHFCSSGLGEIERRLPAGQFSRVHRSAIVNLDRMTSLEKDGSGGMIAHLQNGATVRVSRAKSAQIREELL